jgi:hypothetical protein
MQLFAGTTGGSCFCHTHVLPIIVQILDNLCRAGTVGDERVHRLVAVFD